MIEAWKIARPYAKAVFELARDQAEYDKWSLLLEWLALVVSNKDMAKLLRNPLLTIEEKKDFIISLADKGFMFAEGKSFISIMAQERRLDLFPQIHELFERYRAEAEKTLEVEVASVVALSVEQKAQIKQRLEKLHKRTVSLNARVEPELLGGVMIKADNEIIDGSVRGQLQALQQDLLR